MANKLCPPIHIPVLTYINRPYTYSARPSFAEVCYRRFAFSNARFKYGYVFEEIEGLRFQERVSEVFFCPWTEIVAERGNVDSTYRHDSACLACARQVLAELVAVLPVAHIPELCYSYLPAHTSDGPVRWSYGCEEYGGLRSILFPTDAQLWEILLNHTKQRNEYHGPRAAEVAYVTYPVIVECTRCPFMVLRARNPIDSDIWLGREHPSDCEYCAFIAAREMGQEGAGPALRKDDVVPSAHEHDEPM